MCVSLRGRGKKSSFLFSDTSGGQRHKRGAALSSSTSVGRSMQRWGSGAKGREEKGLLDRSVGLTPIGRERRLAAWVGRGRRRLLCWQLAITFLASPPKGDGGGASSSSSSSAAVWGGGHLIWQSPPPTPLSEGGMEGKKWWEEGS